MSATNVPNSGGRRHTRRKHPRNPLERTAEAIRGQLDLKESVSQYRLHIGDQPAFDGFRSPLDVVRFLADEGDDTYPQRDRVTRDCIQQLQTHDSEVWPGILTLAGMPLLLRLRRRHAKLARNTDDLDQTLIAGLLEVLREFDLNRHQLHTWPFIKSSLSRSVGQDQRADLRHRLQHHLVDPDDLDGDRPQPESQSCNNLILNDLEREDLVRLLEARVGHLLPPEDLKIVIETRIYGRSLRECVTGVASIAEVELEYQRIKRRHSRTSRIIQQNLCPRCGGRCLCLR